MKDWWIRERRNGLLDQAVLSRPDCAQGSQCPRQKDAGHARECKLHTIYGVGCPLTSNIVNHVIAPSQDSGTPPGALSSSSAAGPSSSTTPVPAPLAAASSIDAVANLILPQTQATGSSQQLRNMSTLSFLLNAADVEEAASLPTIAQVLQASSASDIREAIDAYTS